MHATVVRALTGQRLTVTGSGRAINSQTRHQHQIKRVNRLLSSRHLQADTTGIYRTLSQRRLGTKAPPHSG